MAILEFILNNKDYLEDLITRSTYHSNAIEGSTLTYAETYAILYNDNSFKIKGKEPMEIYEAFFPFFYRHKILLPVGWAYRLIRGVTARRKKVKSELLCLYRYDNNKMKR